MVNLNSVNYSAYSNQRNNQLKANNSKLSQPSFKGRCPRESQVEQFFTQLEKPNHKKFFTKIFDYIENSFQNAKRIPRYDTSKLTAEQNWARATGNECYIGSAGRQAIENARIKPNMEAEILKRDMMRERALNLTTVHDKMDLSSKNYMDAINYVDSGDFKLIENIRNGVK